MNQDYTQEMTRELAAGRAAFCDFLTSPLLNLADAAYVQQIRSPEFCAILENLAQDEDIHPQISKGAGTMLGFLKENNAASDETLLQTLGVERTRLFRGVSPSYGPPPPYENEWAPKSAFPMDLLKQISAIYLEDGLAMDGETPERFDYLGVELAYIAQLARREAAALSAGDDILAAAALDRQFSFFQKHLLPWVPAYVKKALEYARTDFYTGYLWLLEGFLLDQAEIFAEMLGE